MVEVAPVELTLAKKALVEVRLVTLKVAGEKLAAVRFPLTYKLVVLAPLPATKIPPLMIVVTPAPPVRASA